MAFQYSIDPDEGFIIERFYGPVYPEAIYEALEQVAADPLYQHHFDGMVDLREAVMEVRFPEMLKLSLFQKQDRNTSTGRWVFIADTVNNFGSMRMFQTLVEDMPLQVTLVRSLEEAETWRAQLTKRK